MLSGNMGRQVSNESAELSGAQPKKNRKGTLDACLVQEAVKSDIKKYEQKIIHISEVIAAIKTLNSPHSAENGAENEDLVKRIDELEKLKTSYEGKLDISKNELRETMQTYNHQIKFKTNAKARLRSAATASGAPIPENFPCEESAGSGHSSRIEMVENLEEKQEAWGTIHTESTNDIIENAYHQVAWIHEENARLKETIDTLGRESSEKDEIIEQAYRQVAYLAEERNKLSGIIEQLNRTYHINFLNFYPQSSLSMISSEQAGENVPVIIDNFQYAHSVDPFSPTMRDISDREQFSLFGSPRATSLPLDADNSSEYETPDSIMGWSQAS